MEKERFPVITHGVKGMLSRKEANFLYDTSKRIGGGLYAELGTFCGKSAVCFAGGMKEYGVEGHIITIDSYNGQALTRGKPRLMAAVAETLVEKGVESYVTLVQGDTAGQAENFQDKRFDFLFIDADHSYEGCKADFVAWSPLVKSGGEIAFHDAHREPVNRVINESGWERYDVDTIAVIKKP
jgi:predicted O-methyltransferase YrrM